MKTIGSLLKDTRLSKKYSLKKVEEETRIKEEFIKAIENGDWQALPDYTVVSGFVKSLAKFFSIEELKAVAILRRDYPPQKNPLVNPKQDVSKKFVWSPKLTFFVGISLVIVLVLGYLGFQYHKFMSPPSLDIYEPKEEAVIKSINVVVLGKTDSDATVKVNNQSLIVGDDGNFEGEIQIYKGTTEIIFKAKSRSGKETVVRRTIKPEL